MRSRRAARPLVRYGVAVAVLTAIAAPISYAASGWDGVACVVLAAGACGAPGAVVLIAQAVVTDPKWALLHVLLGFFLRMGIPLAVCMVVYLSGGPLVEAGFVFYLLVFYLALLAVGGAIGLPRETAIAPKKQ